MITRHIPGAEVGIVLLHGRGGSGDDILSLLDHAGLAEVAAVAPEAMGHSWWPTSFLAPIAQMEPHVARGLAAVSQGIDALIGQGLARDAIWLGGFSQGACLALEAYARLGAGLAGVFGFSGGLVGMADTGAQTPQLYGHAEKRFDYAAKRPGKVWLSVHERDPHIPLKRVEDSATAFRAMGAGVQVKVYPGAGHAILRDDAAALRSALVV